MFYYPGALILTDGNGSDEFAAQEILGNIKFSGNVINIIMYFLSKVT